MSEIRTVPVGRGRTIEITDDVEQMLRRGAVVAMNVSGGKDSDAVAIATNRALDELGHTGPRVLAHADLGLVEWEDSLPACRRLSKWLGLELLTFHRGQGDMTDRWDQRWAANWERYRTLRTVRLVLPWSTPMWRFCTRELKIDVIGRELSVRYPGHEIICVTGIRREESEDRARAAVAKEAPELKSVRRQTSGLNWNPILAWTEEDVYALHAEENFPLHEAYVQWQARRVSCVFCIFSTRSDMEKAAACPGNAPAYRRMVDLEIRSAYAFQNGKWLGDLAPALLTPEGREAHAEAKARAAKREAIEARIPKNLLYTAGWPNAVPTLDEAELLADVRAKISALYASPVEYTDAASVIGRYEELMILKAGKPESRRRQPIPLVVVEPQLALL